MAEILFLWEAASYQHPSTGRTCQGKIHALRTDDWSRTVCGRYIEAIGGTQSAMRGIESSTCGGCKNSIASQKRLAAQTEVWRAEQEREAEEWRERYLAYLRTPQWALLRSRVLSRAKNVCEGCGIAAATQVHHCTYRRLGHEMLFDLVAVCDGCHTAIHHRP